MTTITKEQVHAVSDLKAGYTLGHADVAILQRLARIALAAQAAGPVYQWRERYIDSDLWDDCTKEQYEGFAKHPDFETRILYTAPPAPVSVPDEMTPKQASRSYCGEVRGYRDGWNASRAAILQDAGGNSTVVPDGWVLVPVEPTEDMIVNGFESEPDESFSDEKEWEEYDAMSGCQQAAHRAKLCYAAMIAAAPKP
ncbi:hypothetical protein NTH60_002502 [Enterobacter ludwigii]|nr:hypothetical protein [Enterobacter ludwigii]